MSGDGGMRPRGLRWSKFWWSDWSGDKALRMCSLAARGLWMELLAIMHEAEPYGHLLVNGKRISPRQIGQIVGAATDQVTACLKELEEAGVFSRTEDGVPFSRRMVRDNEASIQGAINGKRGGNPALKGGVNPSRRKPGPKPGKRRNSKAINSGNSGEEFTENTNDANDLLGGITPPLKHQEAEAEAESQKGISVPDKGTPASDRSRGRSRAPRAGDPDGFAEWWDRYPLKTDRRHAAQAYAAALRRGAKPPDLLAGLARYSFQPDPKFWPHGSTWLNGDRWRDEPPLRLVHDATTTQGGPHAQSGGETRSVGGENTDIIRQAVLAATGLAGGVGSD